MILAAPWALLGLLALPLVWWFHMKLRRPLEVELPSLMFVVDEDEAHALPRGRRLDAELLLALTATALLALAAAGPRLVGRAPHRLVRVVVSGGAPLEADGARGRVRTTLEAIRAAVGPEGEVVVRYVPEMTRAAALTPRPPTPVLLDEALAGRASLRVVVSDLPAPAESPGVTWVSIGDPGASNVGIVAAAVRERDGAPEVFLTLANDGPRAWRGAVQVSVAGRPSEEVTRVPVEIGAASYASLTTRPVVPTNASLEIDLRDPAGAARHDALAADDRVQLLHGATRVFIDPELPTGHVTAVRRACRAALGESGANFQTSARDPCDLAIVRRGAARKGPARIVLELEPLPDGSGADRAPPGVEVARADPLVRDLSAVGVGWVYAHGAAEPGPGEEALLGRSAANRLWVVVGRSQRVRLAPDPLRGTPRPVDTPFWPLFVENLLAEAGGLGVGAGYRARGLLDTDSSRLGRAPRAFDAAAVSAVPATEPGRDRPLRNWLVLGALACMGLLWASPRVRLLLDRRPLAAGVSPSPHA